MCENCERFGDMYRERLRDEALTFFEEELLPGLMVNDVVRILLPDSVTPVVKAAIEEINAGSTFTCELVTDDTCRCKFVCRICYDTLSEGERWCSRCEEHINDDYVNCEHNGDTFLIVSTC